MIKFLFFLLVTLALVDPATVRKINAAKAAAEEAYRKGDYLTAVRHYQFLVDSMGVNEDEVVLNLANAFYLAKDTANAFDTYQAVSESPKPDIRSKANQQLGIMANKQGRSEEALNFFKQAIRSEPSNDDARYNYEMLKKKLEEKKKEEEKEQQNKDQQKNDEQKQEDKKEEQKDQKEKDQEKKDEQNKDQKQKEQEQKEKEQKEQQEKEQKEQEKKQEEQKESEKKEMQNLDREKLEQMKISEEKARMILEAMKNQEKQYLQQQKRKPTQSRDRSKPDW